MQQSLFFCCESPPRLSRSSCPSLAWFPPCGCLVGSSLRFARLHSVAIRVCGACAHLHSLWRHDCNPISCVALISASSGDLAGVFRMTSLLQRAELSGLDIAYLRFLHCSQDAQQHRASIAPKNTPKDQLGSAIMRVMCAPSLHTIASHFEGACSSLMLDVILCATRVLRLC